jgi:hypothetical protein
MEPDYSSAYDSSSSLSSSTSIGSPIPPLGRLYSEIIRRTGSNQHGQKAETPLSLFWDRLAIKPDHTLIKKKRKIVIYIGCKIICE